MLTKLSRTSWSTFLGVIAALAISSLAVAEETQPASSPPTGIAASVLRHLDVASPLKDGELRRVLIRQPYGSLQHLGAGVYVSDVLGTASSTILHVDAKGRLRHTQFTVGAEGALAIDSSLVDDGDMVRSLVVYDANGILRRIPTGVEEVDEVGPCIDASLEADEPLESLLDCLGLGGGGGGGSSDPGFANWLDQLWNPDCDSGHIAASAISEFSKQMKSALATIEELVEGTEWEDMTGELISSVQSSLALVELASETLSNSTFPTDSSRAYLADRMDDLRHSVAQLVAFVGHGVASGAFHSPIPGPDGGGPPAANDPRCEERKTDSARGTLFANSDFCKSGDVMQCLAEEQDPIRRITDGKCKTTEGIDGRAMLTCGDNSEWSVQNVKEFGESESSSTCGASPDGTQSYCDFNVPFEGKDDIGKQYIDTMDLGPVFSGLCAADDCGIPQYP